MAWYVTYYSRYYSSDFQFSSIHFLLIPSTKRNSECIFSKIQSSGSPHFSSYHTFSMFMWSQLKFHAKMFFAVLTFICLSASWFLRVADTCQSRIFNVLNLIFNLKTHQTYYEAWWQWWFSCWVVSDSCYPVDCSPPCSSVYGILQAKILEWAAISFPRGYSQARYQTMSLIS